MPFPPIRDTKCKLCVLNEQAKAVCIPSRRYDYGAWGERHYPRALFVVGMAPGWEENENGKCFIGPSGNLLNKAYIEYFKFPEIVDVYIGNSVRCYVRQKQNVSKTQLTACQGYLFSDIRDLQTIYDEVIILCVGSVAAKSVWGADLKTAFSRQGDRTTFRALTASKSGVPTPKAIDLLSRTQGLKLTDNLYPKPCRVFSTYHPAKVLRDPSSGLVVKAHLQLLHDHLTGTPSYRVTAAELNPQTGDRPPLHCPPASLLPAGSLLTLDLETYGLLKGHNQRYFHPVKSRVHDSIPYTRQVYTAHIAWRDKDGQLLTGWFDMQQPSQRFVLWQWIRRVRDTGGTLHNQNIVFDLLYLLYMDGFPSFRSVLAPPLRLSDLMVTNYLHDEGRPERSLKALAPLLSITKYSGEFRQYSHPDHPELIAYGCQDAAATLLCQERLEKEIVDFYGVDTNKLSPFCREWYSRLIWLNLWMSDSGVAMDTARVQALHDESLAKREDLLTTARSQYDLILGGKGSQKSRLELLTLAKDLLGADAPALKLTDAKKEISVCDENRNALLDAIDRLQWVPTSGPWGRAINGLEMLATYQSLSKIIDSYTTPLLQGGRKGRSKMDPAIIKGICYPRWFIVPSEYDDGQTGGTKQARLSAKSPAVQTFPPAVKKCMSCRFPDGTLLWWDYSQLELRVAAIWYNDPVMIDEYSRPGPDLHGKTARLIFGDDIVNDPEYRTKYRQGGKTYNFRGIYRGGAEKAQATLMKDLGIYLSLGEIKEIDARFWERHRALWEGQERVIAEVSRKGYLELPLIGQSRLFLGSQGNFKKGDYVPDTPTIVNMGVQALAADIAEDAMYELAVAFRQHRLKSLVTANIHDASPIEVYPGEMDAVRRIMEKVLPNPPYFEALCATLGRRVLLEYDVKVA